MNSALNLALKSVVRHDELEKWKHGGLRDSNPFPSDRAQNVGLQTCE